MKSNHLILGVALLALVGLGFYFYTRGEGSSVLTGSQELKINPQEVDFGKVGTIVFNNPGLKKDTPYLIYEEPGKPALSKELKLDEFSICAADNGSEACVALNAPLEMILGGKRAAVEGKTEGEIVLARKIRVLRENEVPLLPNPGLSFISWPEALSLIQGCQLNQVTQTHSLDIYFDLKDGTRVRSVSPAIDQVFQEIDKVKNKCGNFPIATE